jgi:hypothetical protein
MFIFTVTEKVANSVAKTFGVIILLAIVTYLFSLLGEVIGVPPAVIFAALLIMGLIGLAFLLVADRASVKRIEEELLARELIGDCDFIRLNGTKCVKLKFAGSQYCEYHAAKAQTTEPAKAPAKSSTRRKMKQCGLVQEDGSKCKKLRHPEAQYCSHHASLKSAEASDA